MVDKPVLRVEEPGSPCQRTAPHGVASHRHVFDCSLAAHDRGNRDSTIEGCELPAMPRGQRDEIEVSDLPMADKRFGTNCVSK